MASFANGQVFIYDINLTDLIAKSSPTTQAAVILKSQEIHLPVASVGDNHNIDTTPLSMLYDHTTQTFISSTKSSSDLIRYDLSSGNPISALRGHTQALTCSAWLKTDKAIASGYLSPPSPYKTRTLNSPHIWIVVSGDREGQVLLWEVGKWRSQAGLVSGVGMSCEEIRPLRVLSAHNSPVSCLGLDAMKIVSGGEDGHVRVFDVLTGRVVRLFHVRSMKSVNPNMDVMGNVVEAVINLQLDRQNTPKFLEFDSHRLLVTINGQIKIWDIPSSRSSIEKGGKRKTMRARANSHAQKGSSMTSPKQTFSKTIKDELLDMEFELEEDEKYKKNVVRYQGALPSPKSALKGKDLNEDELVNYATMLSLETLEQEKKSRSWSIDDDVVLERAPIRETPDEHRGIPISRTGKDYHSHLKPDWSDDEEEPQLHGRSFSMSGSFDDMDWIDMYGSLGSGKGKGKKVVFGSGISGARRAHDSNASSLTDNNVKVSSSWKSGGGSWKDSAASYDDDDDEAGSWGSRKRRPSKNNYEKVAVAPRASVTQTGMTEDDELQYALELSMVEK